MNCGLKVLTESGMQLYLSVCIVGCVVCGSRYSSRSPN